MPKWIEPVVTNNPITCSVCLHGVNYVGVGAKARCSNKEKMSRCVKFLRCYQTLDVCSKAFRCNKNLWVRPRNYYRTVKCKRFTPLRVTSLC